jgi:hypothetical protein
VDVYHVWFNLKDDVRDVEFADAVRAYLGHLKGKGEVVDFRITRRKLGLGHPNLPEWHITLDFQSLAQMDQAFGEVSTRAQPVEGLHQAVNSKVKDIFFALYRDFPDPGRQRGQERF